MYSSPGGTGSRPPDTRPALIVIDDLPYVPVPREPGLLTLVCGPAAHTTDGADAAIRLGPLDADAVRAIAAGYAPAHVSEIPAERAAAMSGGLPGAVHECARRWAHARPAATSMRSPAAPPPAARGCGP